MPYGLSNLPSVFQNFMNEVFRDMLHRFVIVYIDDILIYSPNLDEHQQHVTQVLQRLRQHHLYLKLEKCEFHQSTVQFLGYVITPDGVQMDQGKEEAVRNWPQPTTVKELQRFLGFASTAVSSPNTAKCLLHLLLSSATNLSHYPGRQRPPRPFNI